MLPSTSRRFDEVFVKNGQYKEPLPRPLPEAGRGEEPVLPSPLRGGVLRVLRNQLNLRAVRNDGAAGDYDDAVADHEVVAFCFLEAAVVDEPHLPADPAVL